MPCKILEELGYEPAKDEKIAENENILGKSEVESEVESDIQNTCNYTNSKMTSWGGNLFQISRVNDMPTTKWQAIEKGQPEPNGSVQI